MSGTDTHRAAHEAWNRRDHQTCVGYFNAAVEYTDVPRAITVKSAADWDTWARAWVTGFSDGQLCDARYIDGGDSSVSTFSFRGTNDGPTDVGLATGARVDLPLCEVIRYGDDGTIVRGELFYDAMTLLVQLGLLQPPTGP